MVVRKTFFVCAAVLVLVSAMQAAPVNPDDFELGGKSDAFKRRGPIEKYHG